MSAPRTHQTTSSIPGASPMLGTSSSSGPRYPPDNHDSTASTSLMNGESSTGSEERSEKDQFRLNMEEGNSSGKTSFGIAHHAGGGQLEQVGSHPALPVACYCLASILMTVVNKASSVHCALTLKLMCIIQFVLSGSQFNMNFLLLTIQSVVCVSCVAVAKHMRVSHFLLGLDFAHAAVFQLLTFRDFDTNDARKWFPISFLLVSVIYTGSKSLVSCPLHCILHMLIHPRAHSNTFPFPFIRYGKTSPSS